MALKVLVTYTAKPNHGQAFLNDILSAGLQEQVLAENGCSQYHYFTAANNPDEILLVETWENRETQKVHLDQPHMAGIYKAIDDHIVDTNVELFDI